MKKNPNHWKNVRDDELKILFSINGLDECELKWEGCQGWPLTFAHSLRRNAIDAYLSKGDKKGYEEKMREVIRACQTCHLKLDSRKRKATYDIVRSVIANRGFDINDI